MSTSPYLSVIVPAYNEEQNYSTGALNRLENYLRQVPFTWEVLLVNDGSTDHTAALFSKFVARHPGFFLIDNPHYGKAATIISGFFRSHGEIILFTDMDQATPITEFNRFQPLLTQGTAVVIGSRSSREGAPFFRQILALGMVIVRTILLRLPYRDTQCGFKAFSRPAATKIFTLLRRIYPARPVAGPAVNPGFDVEILYLARRLGLSIAEVPVEWHYHPSARVSFFRDTFRSLRELAFVRWRGLTNAYSLRS